MNDKVKLRLLIDDLVNESIKEISPVFLPAIKRGQAAGRAQAKKYDKAYSNRNDRGETLSDEVKRRRKEQAQKEDRRKRIESVAQHLKKVFGDKARSAYMNSTVVLDDSHRVSVGIEARESFAGSVFVATLSKDGRQIHKEEFGIGIGAKQSIARHIKKLMKNLQN